MTEPRFPLPRGPVLDWSSFGAFVAPRLPSVEDLPHKLLMTSGRAAIHAALVQLKLPAGSLVLVPTYHCPTMVAPVVHAGFTPAFFALRQDGLPRLEAIDADVARRAKAMLVAHYFGVPRSLAEVRGWCDARGIALIEDCAHCLYGDAGERPVGAWGDLATASLTKFLPLGEGGILASASRPLSRMDLRAPSLRSEVKGGVDVLELAARHGRLAGLGGPFRWLLRMKSGGQAFQVAPQAIEQALDAARMLRDCDMGRVGARPTWVARTLAGTLARSRFIALRQRHFATYFRMFAHVPGARPLMLLQSADAEGTAPYVFPLWVDDPEPVYREARARQLPIFRWNRVWPGTPHDTMDTGPAWSHHVLQLLCHQSLESFEVERTGSRLLDALVRA